MHDTKLILKARNFLSKEFGILPEDLNFIGPWDTGVGIHFLTFNIMREGHIRHKSTVTYRINK